MKWLSILYLLLTIKVLLLSSPLTKSCVGIHDSPTKSCVCTYWSPREFSFLYLKYHYSGIYGQQLLQMADACSTQLCQCKKPIIWEELVISKEKLYCSINHLVSVGVLDEGNQQCWVMKCHTAHYSGLCSVKWIRIIAALIQALNCNISWGFILQLNKHDSILLWVIPSETLRASIAKLCPCIIQNH